MPRPRPQRRNGRASIGTHLPTTREYLHARPDERAAETCVSRQTNPCASNGIRVARTVVMTTNTIAAVSEDVANASPVEMR